MIGKITRVDLRDVWKHEANDFTKWLVDNIDVLSKTISVELKNAEREKSAGDFSVDIVAEDPNGNPVIIENQLEKSNHNHLGKIITYLTAYQAKAAIWIVKDARPEHISAITWLNESSSASFYLLKIEAIRIDKSSPAPLLSFIVGPTNEGRTIGDKKKEIAERHLLRKKFWSMLLDCSKKKTNHFSTISPSDSNLIATGAGISGVYYQFTITQHEASIELYIDRGKDSEQENLKIFRNLEDQKEEIEKKFGGALIWEDLEERRACRIRTQVHGGYRDPEEEWHSIHEHMVDTMIRFREALDPFIKNLKI